MQTDIIWISRSQSLNCIKVVRVLDPATGGDTFIANFSNDSLKYTDLENVTNKGEISSDQASDEASVTYTIDKSAGTATVSAGTIRVKVVDEIDNTTPIKGAEFKIQTKLNGKWSDYYIRGRKAIARSNASGEAVITGLSKGIFVCDTA